MPWCCVPDCTNNAKTGFRLFRLPSEKSNAERRQLWLNCMGRSSITDHSKICEAHFSPSQFENVREDGRRLLKPFAYPDLLEPQPLIDCTSLVNVELGGKRKKPSSYLAETIKIIVEGDETDEALPSMSNDKHDSSDLSSVISIEDDNTSWDDSQEFPLEQSVRNLNNVINTLKRKLDESSRRCHRLEEELKRRSSTKLGTIFTEDQLQYLERNTCRGSTWSEETIEKALRLYLACGAKGYEEICRQNLPYPSVRTIQHHLRGVVVHQVDSFSPKKKEQP